MKIFTKLIVLIIFTSLSAYGQNNIQKYNTTYKKGDLYLYWGWNRGAFSRSDITFKGNDYNFTLENVIADDRQSKFNFDKYLNPANATIPQYNFRAGYFISTKYNLTFGIDHMKYVVSQNQTVNINGSILHSETAYDGEYHNDKIQLTDDFLKFEHTDGLNYINFGLRRQDQLFAIGSVALDILLGGEIGFLIPRTNSTLLSKEKNDQFHLSGLGASGVAGIQLSFFRNFFIQSELKWGYINMPDIRTTMSKTDKAHQQFFFSQLNIVFGGTIHLNR